MSRSMTIYFSDQIAKDLRHFAKLDGIPVNTLIHKIIRKEIFLRRFEELRIQGLPYAEAAGIYTDEDVFKKLGRRPFRSKEGRKVSERSSKEA